jgi:selenium metabolism protein YedF
MEKHVDARGKPCPQPVLMTKRAIEEGGASTIRVAVDDNVAAQNVSRMAASKGWVAELTRDGAGILVRLTKEGGIADTEAEEPALACAPSPSAPEVVVFVASDLFGTGDEELGRILMRSFVKTIKDLDPRPSLLIFVNSAVRLTTEGSHLIEDLLALERSGTRIVSCGTCLDYYRLLDRLRVGTATNMYEIASALVAAGKVVRV